MSLGFVLLPAWLLVPAPIASASAEPEDLAPSAIPLVAPSPEPRPAPELVAAGRGADNRSDKQSPPRSGRRRFFFRAETSGIYERLYSESIVGGTMSLALDFDMGTAVFGAGVMLMDGRVSPGLNLFHGAYEGTLVVKVAMVRLGVTGDLGGVALSSVTNDSNSGALALGGALVFAVDLAHWDVPEGAALFLDAKLSLNAIVGHDGAATNLWGPSLGIGVRL